MKSTGTIIITMLLLSILSLTGCETVFKPWNVEQIEVGMARAQVVQILGEPDYTSMENEGEQLHYLYEKDNTLSRSVEPSIDLDTERTFDYLNRPDAFEQEHYVVILTDGVVARFEQL